MHFGGRGDYQVNAKETFKTTGGVPNGTSRKKTQTKKMLIPCCPSRHFFCAGCQQPQPIEHPSSLFLLKTLSGLSPSRQKHRKSYQEKNGKNAPWRAGNRESVWVSAKTQIVLFFFSFHSFLWVQYERGRGSEGEKEGRALQSGSFFSQRKIKKEEDISTFSLYLSRVTGALQRRARKQRKIASKPPKMSRNSEAKIKL